jgi:hypothetical protein
LDPDVTELLQQQARKSGASFKVTVNHIIRLGLTAVQQTPAKPFVVKPRAMGLPAGLSYDDIGGLLEALEGPAHR